MPEMPKVSVIIPTYNRAHLIGRSIKSVLDQTFIDFELIVVDDGSTDNTEEVVKAYNDQRIRYIRYTKNRGAPAARNTGIRAARGEYIAFNDSDDEWLPQKLERQMAFFERDQGGNLGLVVCDYWIVRKNKEILCKPIENRLNYERLLEYFSDSGIGTTQFILKRNIVSPELYFDEKLVALQDWDLLLRLSRICRIECAKESLVRWYWGGNELQIYTPRNRINARNYLMNKYKRELEARPKALAFGLRKNALDYYEIGQVGSLRHHLKATIKAYPWKPGIWIQYIASLSGIRGFRLFMKTRLKIGSWLLMILSNRLSVSRIT
jgi:glycosyltransferase involved in cell wall biosynthesis